MIPKLPGEICIEIFELLEFDRDDLMTLCVTSRFFCSLAQPVLFHRMELKPSPYSIARIAAIQATLIRNPERRRWIRILRITGCLYRSKFAIEDGGRKYEEATIELISQLTHIRHIYLHGMAKRTLILESLLHLNSPTRTSLYNAEVNNLAVTMTDMAVNPTTLHLNNSLITFPVDMASTTSIVRSITEPFRHHSSLRTLELIETRFFDVSLEIILKCDTMLEALTKLVVTQPGKEKIPSLLEFLRLCPALRDIEIRRGSYFVPHVPIERFSRDASLIPKLARVSGHINWAKTLINGRPITVLDVFMTRVPQVDLIPRLAGLSERLTGRSSPLRELHLGHSEWDDDQLHQLVTMFPLLSHLTLNLAESIRLQVNWFVDRFPEVVRSLGRLEVVVFRKVKASGDIMVQILNSLDGCPRLLKVELHGGSVFGLVVWTKAGKVWKQI